MTLDEIAERLALPRTTVYYWIREMPRPQRCVARQAPPRLLGTRAMQLKYTKLRINAYEQGAESFDQLSREAGFLDFVIMFIAEGHKRSRHSVSIANSDPAVISLVNSWLERLASKPPVYSVQYHADQNLPEIHSFWGDLLGVDAERIRLQRKSNSNHMNKRTWRSRHGVLTASVHDTYLRERMQAWADHVRARWLDSTTIGA